MLTDPQFDAAVPDWIADRLLVLPAAVDREVCEKISALGAALPEMPGHLYNSKTEERYFDPDMRLTNIAWLHGRDWIFDLMQVFAERANTRWAYDLTDADPMQFAVYRRNDFFEWHKDMVRVRDRPIRKVSVVLQLAPAESYRGGVLEFLDHDRGKFVPLEFAAQGSVAVFSSLLRHRVTPIKEGERRSLTAWFKGPPFR